MSYMLLAIFAAAAIGIFAKNFGRREIVLCYAVAATLTVLYFVRPLSMT
jgi:hypothetical protein